MLSKVGQNCSYTESSVLGRSTVEAGSSFHIGMICVVCQGFQLAEVKTQILKGENFLRDQR